MPIMQKLCVSLLLNRFITVYAVCAVLFAAYFLYTHSHHPVKDYSKDTARQLLLVQNNWQSMKQALMIQKDVLPAFKKFDESWLRLSVKEEYLADLENFSSMKTVENISTLTDRFYAKLKQYDQLFFEDSSFTEIFLTLDTALSSLDGRWREYMNRTGKIKEQNQGDNGFVFLLFLPLVIAILLNCGLSKFRCVTKADSLVGEGGYSYLDKQKWEALDVVSDGIIIIDYDGLVDYLNPAATDLLGKDDDFLNQPWYTMLPQQDQLSTKNIALHGMKDKGVWHDEIEFKKGDAAPMILDMYLYALNDGGMVMTARDISELKLTENEASELRKQFFQAQKMESIGRMAGGIAHDFNNILSAIMGYAEFLEEDLPSESMESSFAQKITAASKQAKDLINQILSFSRKNTGEKKPVDLGHLMQVTRDMIKSSMPETIDVFFEDNVKDAYIEGNATEISQVLMNLCVNARDAMEDKRGKLLLSINKVDLLDDADIGYFRKSYLPEDDGSKSLKTHIVNKSDIETLVYAGHYSHTGAYYKLEIADTGSGILPAIIEQIFEPFFTTKDQDKGTGLGLSSSLGIIVGHGGLLKLCSVVGEGTSFAIYFPANFNLQAGNNDKTVSISDAEVTHHDKRKTSVLLVDDDNNVCETMAIMLSRLGIEVTAFENPLEALEHFKAHHQDFDALVSDYMMPEMKGGEFAQKINEINAQIPIIIISGFAEESFEGSLSEFPYVRAFLKKPLRKQDIDKVLKELKII